MAGGPTAYWAHTRQDAAEHIARFGCLGQPGKEAP